MQINCTERGTERTTTTVSDVTGHLTELHRLNQLKSVKYWGKMASFIKIFGPKCLITKEKLGPIQGKSKEHLSCWIQCSRRRLNSNNDKHPTFPTFDKCCSAPPPSYFSILFASSTFWRGGDEATSSQRFFFLCFNPHKHLDGSLLNTVRRKKWRHVSVTREQGVLLSFIRSPKHAHLLLNKKNSPSGY